LNPAPANSVAAITGSFTFTDPGGHLNGGSFNFTYGGSTTTIALGSSFAGVTTGNSPIIAPAQLIASAGTVMIPCWLVDSAGNRSNTVNVTFTQAVARFAYQVADDSTISVYAIDGSTFRLRHNGYYLAGTNRSRCLAVDPSQRFVYSPNLTDGVVYEYTTNQTTGALTPISGNAWIAAGTNPFSVAVDPSGRFAYVTNYAQLSGTCSISQYAIDQSTGALTAIAGSPVALSGASPANPRTVAVDPSGRFAYTANWGNGTVSAFAINQTTGALTEISGSPFPAGGAPWTVVVEPTGRFVYVSDNTGIRIYVYAINQSTGALAQIGGSPFAVTGGVAPGAMTVDPLGGFLYVGDGSNTVYTYAINPNSGALTQASTHLTADNPRDIEVDPVSGYVYVTESNATVNIYRQVSGVLTPLATPQGISTRSGPPGNPEPALNLGPYQIAMMFGSSRATYVPEFAYAANSSDTTVSEFSINQTTGVLSGGATAAAGTSPRAVAVDPSGQFAYVANYTAGGINEYTINQVTGALSGSGTIGAGTNPQAVAVDPSGRFAYVANNGSNTVSQYTITAGVLSAQTPATIATGAGPEALTVDPAGRFLYVANNTDGDISEYTIDQTTGALTAVAGSPIGGAVPLTGAQVVAVEPMGMWAYVAVSAGGVYAYSINIDNPAAGFGALQIIGGAPVASGASPQAIAFDPLGRWAYVACNGGGGNVYVYSIGVTGALTAATPASYTAANAWGVAVDPSGQFLYVTNKTGNNVSVFSIGALGALTPMASSPATGNAPEGIAVTGTIE
jgi:6-phosphogluconolactonase (cycloisomerase 2 family)